MTTENYLQLKSFILRDIENKKRTFRFISIMLGILAVIVQLWNIGNTSIIKEMIFTVLLCGSFIVAMFCFDKDDLRLQRLNYQYKNGTDFDTAAKEFGQMPDKTTKEL